MTNRVIYANFAGLDPIDVLVVLHLEPESFQNKYFGQLDDSMIDRIERDVSESFPGLRVKDCNLESDIIELHFYE